MSEGGAGAAGAGGAGGAGREAVRPWLLAAGACAVAAAVFWWLGLGDAAFVAAALGVVAWFMNQRAFYRKVRDEHENVEDDAEDEPGDEDGRG